MSMTAAEAPPPPAQIPAVELIDAFLSETRNQTLVTQTDVVNFALDVRHLLTGDDDGTPPPA